MLRKAQSGVELLVLVSFLLAIFVSIFFLNERTSNSITGQVSSSQASVALSDLGNAAELVYNQGVGSKTVVRITLPLETRNIIISNRSLILNLSVGNSSEQLVRTFGFDVAGQILAEEGEQEVTVIAADGIVFFNLDNKAPTAFNGKPTGTVFDLPLLTMATNENAICKGSLNVDEDYENMDFVFNNSGTYHNYQTSSLASANYTVYVRCNDTSGNVANESYSWSFELIRMLNVTLNTDKLLYVENETITFSGGNYISSVKFWVSNSTENVTSTTLTANSSGNITHQWNTSICDQNFTAFARDLTTGSEANTTFEVLCYFNDTSPPNITLMLPVQNGYSGTNATFIYNVSDETSIANCSLIINNSINITDPTITLGVNQSFNLSMADGKYMWSVNCTDSYNNKGSSVKRNLTVDSVLNLETVFNSSPPVRAYEEDFDPTWDVEVQFDDNTSFAHATDEGSPSYPPPDYVEFVFPDFGFLDNGFFDVSDARFMFKHRDNPKGGTFPDNDRRQVQCYDGVNWNAVEVYALSPDDDAWVYYQSPDLSDCIISPAVANNIKMRVTFDPSSDTGATQDIDYAYINVTLKSAIYANLCERVEDAPQPVDFSSGLNTSGNTFGLGMGDDCWDWMEDYNYSGEAACEFNVDPDMDGDISDSTVAADDRLEVRVGGGAPGARKNPNDGAYDGPMSSCAYGIQFEVSDDMMTVINNGGDMILRFDWVADQDAGWGNNLDGGDEAWVKARLTTPSQVVWLGSDLDSGDNDADPYNEVWWADNPYDDSGRETYFLTPYITQTGTYYLDFGAFIGDWDKREEGFGAYFDNIKLVVRK